MRRFLRAVNRAIDDFKDPKIVRQRLPRTPRFRSPVIEAMNLGEWSKNVPPETIQLWIDAAKEEGNIDSYARLSWSAELRIPPVHSFDSPSGSVISHSH